MSLLLRTAVMDAALFWLKIISASLSDACTCLPPQPSPLCCSRSLMGEGANAATATAHCEKITKKKHPILCDSSEASNTARLTHRQRSIARFTRLLNSKGSSSCAPACSGRQSPPAAVFSEPLRVPTPGSADASPTVPAALQHGFRSVAHYPDRSTRFHSPLLKRQESLLFLYQKETCTVTTLNNLPT